MPQQSKQSENTLSPKQPLIASNLDDLQPLVGLQILRAVAALSVVYLHTALLVPFGLFGVDIFFVISGYVMAMVVTKGESPKVFARNRISRIVPLYWLATTGVMILAIIKPGLLNSTTADFANYLRSLFFIPYFKENGAFQPMLLVGWSLNFEMFFYLCVWAAISIERRFFMVITVSLIIGCYICVIYYGENPVARSFFGSQMVFEFLLGIAAFKISTMVGERKIAIWMCPIAFAIMIAGEVFKEGAIDHRLLFFGFPAFALVCAAAMSERSIRKANKHVLRMLTLVGNASYAIYLSHFYVIIGMKKAIFARLELPAFIEVSCLMAASVAVGIVVFHYIDKPLSHAARKGIMRLIPTTPRATA